ncbi:MAG: hypothetical protein WCJ74_03220 [bacterium]
MSKSNKFKRLANWLTKYEKTSTQKGMAGFLVKKGIAKGESTANVELMLVAIIFLMMSKLVFLII